jgi:hypothetical protein
METDVFTKLATGPHSELRSYFQSTLRAIVRRATLVGCSRLLTQQIVYTEAGCSTQNWEMVHAIVTQGPLNVS